MREQVVRRDSVGPKEGSVGREKDRAEVCRGKAEILAEACPRSRKGDEVGCSLGGGGEKKVNRRWPQRESSKPAALQWPY